MTRIVCHSSIKINAENLLGRFLHNWVESRPEMDSTRHRSTKGMKYSEKITAGRQPKCTNNNLDNVSDRLLHAWDFFYV